MKDGKQDQPSPALKNATQDRLGHALLTLAKHVWTLHDRQRVLEAQLVANGLKIDTNTLPDASLLESLDDERESFINDLLSTLTGGDDQSD